MDFGEASGKDFAVLPPSSKMKDAEPLLMVAVICR
jgi:hypothetical protein